jgi:RNA ligase
MKLVSTDTAGTFYCDDLEFRNGKYRVFQYRMLSGIDVNKSEQLECRGTMFKMDGEQAVELVSLAPVKFFNLNENELTQNLDPGNINRIMVKYDGSLMSTVKVKTGLYLKSKGRFESVMANDANVFISKHPALYAELEDLMKNDMTCNMEWVSPDNRIVLSYQDSMLVPFNIRNNLTGETLLDPPDEYPELTKIWAKNLALPSDCGDFIMRAREEEGIEGYVLGFADGDGTLLVKLKTEEYVGLHRIMDLLHNEHALFDLALDDKIDDAVGSLSLQPDDVARFNNMHTYVVDIVNDIVHDVEMVFNERDSWVQKELALVGIERFGTDIRFSTLMNLLKTGSIDYSKIKVALKRNWREYTPIPQNR